MTKRHKVVKRGPKSGPLSNTVQVGIRINAPTVRALRYLYGKDVNLALAVKTSVLHDLVSSGAMTLEEVYEPDRLAKRRTR